MLDDKVLLEFPKFVYFNLPAKYASLVVTVPNRHVEIPENAEATSRPKELSVKMRNNGVYGIHPKSSNSGLLDKARSAVSSDVNDVLDKIGADKLNQLPRNQFIELLKKNSDTSRIGALEYVIQQEIKKEGKISQHKFDAKMAIEGADYKGDYFSFDELGSLRPRVEKDLEIFGSLTHVNKGDYLYRAVDQNEWQQIVRDEAYLIRVETNFEDKVGHQVQNYAKDPAYAGKIIRIKVEGPFFRNAGFQVPRVTSVLPHFANHVEVLDGNTWVSVKDYQKR